MSRRRLGLCAAATVLLGLLVGCTDPSPDQSPTATGTGTATSSASPTADEPTSAAPEPGNQADVEFADAILIYRAQSAQMHQAILSKSGVPEDVLSFAGTLANAQGQETQDLGALLALWGEEPTDPADAGTLPGMLTADELQEMFVAPGPDATVIYLNAMIAHHEETLSLAEEVLTTGTSPEVAEIAEELVASQPPELDELRALLAATDPTATDPTGDPTGTETGAGDGATTG